MTQPKPEVMLVFPLSNNGHLTIHRAYSRGRHKGVHLPRMQETKGKMDLSHRTRVWTAACTIALSTLFVHYSPSASDNNQVRAAEGSVALSSSRGPRMRKRPPTYRPSKPPKKSRGRA